MAGYPRQPGSFKSANLKPATHLHTPRKLIMTLAPKGPERRIDSKRPHGEPSVNSSDFLQYATFRDADPAELREALLDPRRLGRVPQRQWGYYGEVGGIKGWGDDEGLDREPGGYDLPCLLARTTSPCLYCNNEYWYNEFENPEEKCGQCCRPLRATRLEALIVLRLELYSSENLEASMITSINGVTTTAPLYLGANRGPYCGTAAGCEDAEEDPNACKTRESAMVAANRRRLEAFFRLPQSKGLWPVEELIDAHRNIVMEALLTLAIPAAIAGVMTDYHCQALSAPDPIEDYTAITAHDVAEGDWQDKRHEEKIKDTESARIEQSILAEHNTFALKVMRQELLDDREDLGKERISHLVGLIDRQLYQPRPSTGKILTEAKARFFDERVW